MVRKFPCVGLGPIENAGATPPPPSFKVGSFFAYGILQDSCLPLASQPTNQPVNQPASQRASQQASQLASHPDSSQGLPWGACTVLSDTLRALQTTSLGHSHPEGQKRIISEGLFADIGSSQVLKEWKYYARMKVHNGSLEDTKNSERTALKVQSRF